MEQEFDTEHKGELAVYNKSKKAANVWEEGVRYILVAEMKNLDKYVGQACTLYHLVEEGVYPQLESYAKMSVNDAKKLGINKAELDVYIRLSNDESFRNQVIKTYRGTRHLLEKPLDELADLALKERECF